MDRLFINEVELDLGNQTFALTLQVNDLANVQDRQFNFTNQVEVPKTRRNRIALELSDSVQSFSAIPYRKNKARLVKDGVDVIPNGIAIIEETERSFNINLYSGSIDFFSKIDGRYLRDIDLSEYNHEWDFDTIKDNRGQTGEGFLYPIAAFTDDEAYLSTSGIVNPRRLLPAMFVKTIVNKIFEEAGFVLTGEFFSSDFYSKLILVLANETFRTSGKIFYGKKTSVIVPSYADQNLILEDDNSGDPVSQTGTIDIGGNWLDLAGVDNNGQGQRFNFPQTVQVPNQFKLKFHCEATLIGGQPYASIYKIELRCYQSYQVAKRVTSPGFYVTNGSTRNISFDVELPEGTYQSGPGCYVDVRLYTIIPTGMVTLPKGYFTLGSYGEAEIFSEIYLQYGDPFIVSRNIANITQKDFIKAIAQIGAITFQPELNTNIVRGESFAFIAKNKSNALDWSDKLHIQKDEAGNEIVPIAFRFGKYGQKNSFKYKEDENVTTGIGDGEFTVDDETLPGIEEQVKLPFSGSDMIERLDSTNPVKVPRINRFDETASPVVPSIKTEPRLLILDLHPDISGEDVSSLTYNDGTSSASITTDVPYCYFIHPDKEQNLGWNNSLLRDNYSEIVSMLNRAKKIRVKFKLNSIDIQNVDHFRPIYLKQFAAYFYLNKIINYVGANRLTDVELIRL